MTSVMYSGNLEKKFGTSSKNGHTHISSPHRSKSSNNLTASLGTSLSIEIIEVRETSGKVSLVGGPFVCVCEVTDSSHQLVWKQKSSAQFTTKPPIIFGDVFKVKPFSGDFGVDIRPGFTLKVQFCKAQDKSLEEIDSGVVELQDLVVNKEQHKAVALEHGKAEVVLRLTLSNTQYPRGNTLTLTEISQREREKEKTSEEKPSEPSTPVSRTDSVYTLPRLNVRFSIHYHTVPGEEMRVVGSNYKLGDWDPTKAPVMEWTHGGVWVLEVSFRKAFVPFEYKYVLMKDGNPRWENVPENRRVEATDSEHVRRDECWEKLQ
jgi:hypothetical protein